MFNFIKDKKWLIVGGFSLVLLISFALVYYFNDNKEKISESSLVIKETTKESVENFYVDVKGAVKDPGVYLVSDGERVIDAIEKAGGLSRNANTSNINLAQKLESEMVVVVYTNSEIKKKNSKLSCDTTCNCDVIEINNCIENENSNSNLVNINTASIDELMTLSGVGESKAKSIIAYREENGNFKTIEDIKNVSGIGETLFLSIKDKITI